MTIYTENQQRIAGKICKNNGISNWKDWKWQLRHSIHDIKTLERLLGITHRYPDRVLFHISNISSIVGIERILSDFDEEISLTPEDNNRMKRRNNE